MEKSSVGGIPVVKVGNLKILNFNDPRLYPRREGVIVLKPKAKYEKKFRTCSFRSFTEVASGITFGIPTGGTDNHGNIEFRKIMWNGRQKVIDLSTSVGLQEWAVLQHWENVSGSRNDKGRAILEVYDQGVEAKNNIEKIFKGAEAIEKLRNMPFDKIKDFSRLFHLGSEMDTDEVVKNMLAQKAKDDPMLFMEAYNHPHRGIKEVVCRAVASGIIEHTASHGYLFNGVKYLGRTIDECVMNLLEDKMLLQQADSESIKRYNEIRYKKMSNKDNVSFIENTESNDASFNKGEEFNDKDIESLTALANADPGDSLDGKSYDDLDVNSLKAHAIEKGYPNEEWAVFNRKKDKKAFFDYIKSKKGVMNRPITDEF